MQMATSMGKDDGKMIVKRVSVPVGLEELMEGLTKEVILKKPKDLYVFASEYFTHLINLRDKGNFKPYTVRSARSASKPITKQHYMTRMLNENTQSKIIDRKSKNRNQSDDRLSTDRSTSRNGKDKNEKNLKISSKNNLDDGDEEKLKITKITPRQRNTKKIDTKNRRIITQKNDHSDDINLKSKKKIGEIKEKNKQELEQEKKKNSTLSTIKETKISSKGVDEVDNYTKQIKKDVDKNKKKQNVIGTKQKQTEKNENANKLEELKDTKNELEKLDKNLIKMKSQTEVNPEMEKMEIKDKTKNESISNQNGNYKESLENNDKPTGKESSNLNKSDVKDNLIEKEIISGDNLESKPEKKIDLEKIEENINNEFTTEEINNRNMKQQTDRKLEETENKSEKINELNSEKTDIKNEIIVEKSKDEILENKQQQSEKNIKIEISEHLNNEEEKSEEIVNQPKTEEITENTEINVEKFEEKNESNKKTTDEKIEQNIKKPEILITKIIENLKEINTKDSEDKQVEIENKHGIESKLIDNHEKSLEKNQNDKREIKNTSTDDDEKTTNKNEDKNKMEENKIETPLEIRINKEDRIVEKHPEDNNKEHSIESNNAIAKNKIIINNDNNHEKIEKSMDVNKIENEIKDILIDKTLEIIDENEKKIEENQTKIPLDIIPNKQDTIVDSISIELKDQSTDINKNDETITIETDKDDKINEIQIQIPLQKLINKKVTIEKESENNNSFELKDKSTDVVGKISNEKEEKITIGTDNDDKIENKQLLEEKISEIQIPLETTIDKQITIEKESENNNSFKLKDISTDAIEKLLNKNEEKIAIGTDNNDKIENQQNLKIINDNKQKTEEKDKNADKLELHTKNIEQNETNSQNNENLFKIESIVDQNDEKISNKIEIKSELKEDENTKNLEIPENIVIESEIDNSNLMTDINKSANIFETEDQKQNIKNCQNNENSLEIDSIKDKNEKNDEELSKIRKETDKKNIEIESIDNLKVTTNIDKSDNTSGIKENTNKDKTEEESKIIEKNESKPEEENTQIQDEILEKETPNDIKLETEKEEIINQSNIIEENVKKENTEIIAKKIGESLPPLTDNKTEKSIDIKINEINPNKDKSKIEGEKELFTELLKSTQHFLHSEKVNYSDKSTDLHSKPDKNNKIKIKSNINVIDNEIEMLEKPKDKDIKIEKSKLNISAENESHLESGNSENNLNNIEIDKNLEIKDKSVEENEKNSTPNVKIENKKQEGKEERKEKLNDKQTNEKLQTEIENDKNINLDQTEKIVTEIKQDEHQKIGKISKIEKTNATSSKDLIKSKSEKQFKINGTIPNVLQEKNQKILRTKSENINNKLKLNNKSNNKEHQIIKRSISLQNTNKNSKKDEKLLKMEYKDMTKIVESVIKIQSIWRGYQARKQHKIGSEKIIKNKKNDENPFIKAAMKIQKIWRGFKVRKHIKSKNYDENSKTNLEGPTEIDKEKAARKIQANARGFLVRKRMNKLTRNVSEEKCDEQIFTTSQRNANKQSDGNVLNGSDVSVPENKAQHIPISTKENENLETFPINSPSNQSIGNDGRPTSITSISSNDSIDTVIHNEQISNNFIENSLDSDVKQEIISEITNNSDDVVIVERDENEYQKICCRDFLENEKQNYSDEIRFKSENNQKIDNEIINNLKDKLSDVSDEIDNKKEEMKEKIDENLENHLINSNNSIGIEKSISQSDSQTEIKNDKNLLFKEINSEIISNIDDKLENNELKTLKKTKVNKSDDKKNKEKLETKVSEIKNSNFDSQFEENTETNIDFEKIQSPENDNNKIIENNSENQTKISNDSNSIENKDQFLNEMKKSDQIDNESNKLIIKEIFNKNDKENEEKLDEKNLKFEIIDNSKELSHSKTYESEKFDIKDKKSTSQLENDININLIKNTEFNKNIIEKNEKLQEQKNESSNETKTSTLADSKQNYDNSIKKIISNSENIQEFPLIQDVKLINDNNIEMKLKEIKIINNLVENEEKCLGESQLLVNVLNDDKVIEEIAKTSGTEIENASKQMDNEEIRECRDCESQTHLIVNNNDRNQNIAIQLNQTPAGAQILTSSTSVSSVDDDAQASLNDATKFKAQSVENPTLSSATTTTTVNKMENEKTNGDGGKDSTQIEAAATKIQAGFRGYQVRKQLKNKTNNGEISNQRRSGRRKSSGRLTDQTRVAAPKESKDLEEKSAIKIQASIRGFLVRRRQKKLKQTKESA